MISSTIYFRTPRQIQDDKVVLTEDGLNNLSCSKPEEKRGTTTVGTQNIILASTSKSNIRRSRILYSLASNENDQFPRGYTQQSIHVII